MKRIMILLMISFLVLSFGTAVFSKDDSAGDPYIHDVEGNVLWIRPSGSIGSIGDVAGDVLWIRPLGFIGTALKAIAFVISLPVTTVLKTKNEAEEFLIKDPQNFYFKRPVGKF